MIDVILKVLSVVFSLGGLTVGLIQSDRAAKATKTFIKDSVKEEVSRKQRYKKRKVG